jgi:hypothetical protein
MSYLESAIEAGEDLERDVNGAGSKEALNGYFLPGQWVPNPCRPSGMNEFRGLGWMIVHMSFGSGSLISVSVRALLYKGVINVHMSTRSLLYNGI